MPESMADEPKPNERLKVRGLHLSRGGRKILDSIDLDAPAGKVTCILGPNGAGKSCLLRAIAGLWESEGTIELEGQDLRSLSPMERATKIAYVPQRSGLRAPLSVRHVVEQGRYALRSRGQRVSGVPQDHKQAVERALSWADLTHLSHRPFDRLSVGERGRVLFARALATGAKTLLLDEPTAALDVGHALDLLTRLRQLADEGFRLLVVLHSLQDVYRYADRALMLEAGKRVIEGDVKEVICPEVVSRVYGVTMLENAALDFRLNTGAEGS